MARDEWLALAERCEKATGLDREIDFKIGFATGWRKDIIDGNEMVLDWECNEFPNHYGSLLPSVTESLDAITALIERELPGLGWRIAGRDEHGGKPYAQIRWPIKDQVWKQEISHAATPALAICAAFCRAMADKETT